MTELEMHQALQPFYREVMGDWQIGDACFQKHKGFGLITMTCIKTVTVFFSVGNSYCSHDNPYLLWLPRTIDDSSPEAFKRSLWGMVDWDRFCLDSDRGLNIIRESDKGVIYTSCYPTTVILRALCAQNGIGVK